MPVMDGQAFIAAYHKLPTKHAPIILTTAAEVNRGQFPGIAQFVRKPFDVDELLNALETVLDQRQPFGMSA
jgi:CheY-like chemotaxis protein